jgi:Flp pilus assembly protein TadB
MNSGTLVGSLIFAAVLVVAIAVAIQLMMLGWRRRARRQSELIGNLPDVPDQVGGATGSPQVISATAAKLRLPATPKE